MKTAIKFTILTLLICFLSASSYLQERDDNSSEKRLTFSEIQNQAKIFYNLDGEIKKPGWKQYKRWEWLAGIRLDEDGYFTPSLNWMRWLQKRSRFPKATSTDLADWKSMGPFHVGKMVNDSSTQGLGRLNCIAFDPRDQNILWVGSPCGGLWKSTDYGTTWSSNTDCLPNIGISDILIHPDNPDIMYIALGDHDAGHSLSVGIMKSKDGGETWKLTGLNPLINEMWLISNLIMHPDDPETIFAATNHGIYKSTNGGLNWEMKNQGNFESLVVSPVNSSLWYASQWGSGIYRSNDSGENWTRITNGLPTSGLSRVNLAVSPSNPQIIYASYAEDGNDYYTGFGFYGLYRSLDGGESWSLRANTPNVFGASVGESASNPYSLGHYAQVLTISPTDPDIIYLGSVNLWKSEDGGLTWNFITHSRGFGGAAEVHVDHHDLVFLPGSTQIMFLCNDGGLYRSDDAGWTWVDLSEGLIIRQVYRFGLSPHDPDQFIFGSHDNGSEYFNGEWLSVMGADGMECFIDPHDPDIIYFSYQNAALYRSEDGGYSYINIAEDLQGDGYWVAPFVMDPVNSSTIYTAIDRVLKSTNRGTTWHAISQVLSGRNLSIIAVSPSNPYCMLVSDAKTLLRTRDGGTNWERLTYANTAEIITDIAYHPRNPEIVYITLGGYGEWFGWFGYGSGAGDYTFDAEKILRSQDGGSTWTNITGAIPEMPVTCVAIDPNSSAVYVGTDLGVFYSRDGNGNWMLFEEGLPNVVVTELDISPLSNKIWASTFGRGMWRSPLANESVEPLVKPPKYFSGIRYEDKSLFQKRYIHILEWGANPENESSNISAYRIYKLENGSRILLGETDRNTTQYRNMTLHSNSVTYELTAIDQNYNESLALSVTVY